jgi:hypothetical protein
MILQRGLKSDKQVAAAVKLINNEKTFDKVLANGSYDERIDGAGRLNLASADVEEESTNRGSLQVEW